MPTPLQAALAEIERHVSESGWDRPPQLFALADTADLVRREPRFAELLGIGPGQPSTGDLTPVEQDPLPAGPLDEALATIGWPDHVRGCALVQEVLVLPPGAEEALPDRPDVSGWVAEHPERREARLAVAVLRDGTRASAIRMRGTSPDERDDLLLGDDLAPNLADALRATLD